MLARNRLELGALHRKETPAARVSTCKYLVALAIGRSSRRDAFVEYVQPLVVHGQHLRGDMQRFADLSPTCLT